MVRHSQNGWHRNRTEVCSVVTARVMASVSSLPMSNSPITLPNHHFHTRPRSPARERRAWRTQPGFRPAEFLILFKIALLALGGPRICCFVVSCHITSLPSLARFAAVAFYQIIADRLVCRLGQSQHGIGVGHWCVGVLTWVHSLVLPSNREPTWVRT